MLDFQQLQWLVGPEVFSDLRKQCQKLTLPNENYKNWIVIGILIVVRKFIFTDIFLRKFIVPSTPHFSSRLSHGQQGHLGTSDYVWDQAGICRHNHLQLWSWESWCPYMTIIITAKILCVLATELSSLKSHVSCLSSLPQRLVHETYWFGKTSSRKLRNQTKHPRLSDLLFIVT